MKKTKIDMEEVQATNSALKEKKHEIERMIKTTKKEISQAVLEIKSRDPQDTDTDEFETQHQNLGHDAFPATFGLATLLRPGKPAKLDGRTISVGSVLTRLFASSTKKDRAAKYYCCSMKKDDGSIVFIIQPDDAEKLAYSGKTPEEAFEVLFDAVAALGNNPCDFRRSSGRRFFGFTGKILSTILSAQELEGH
ncbi:MAG: uncharacterized protein A8A55_2097 [Amphiamblys sp. WSBS2006]|nr:MAG: uncharacterized protein A8A55_2097 [Amphiamblys sp. WSBS2006]